jgi:signal transduction histidine kinase
LHDDVGSRLVTIRGRIDLFRTSSPVEDKDRHLTTASQVTIQAADAIRNVVWFLNPDHDSADDVVTKMKGAAARMLADIDYSFVEDNRATLPIMDMEFRRNFVLLFQEALNNIVKHSRATKVIIRLNVDDRQVDLSVTDNGVGFISDEKKEGHGLGSLKHRAEQMNGVGSIASSPGAGTTVTLKAPLPKLPLVVRLRSVVMKLFTRRRIPSSMI